MQVKQFVFNPLQVNSYLLYSGEDAVLIDPAMMGDQEKKEIKEFVRENSLNLTKVLYTHGHMDHVSGSAWLKSTFGAKIYGSKKDDMLLSTAVEHGKAFGLQVEKPAEIDENITEGTEIEVGEESIECIPVPGHSPGGFSFVHHESASVFCGDSVFAGSIGRTDLPGGDYDILLRSIKEKILKLPAHYKLFPGHGESTSIEEELKTNPFFGI